MNKVNLVLKEKISAANARGITFVLAKSGVPYTVLDNFIYFYENTTDDEMEKKIDEKIRLIENKQYLHFFDELGIIYK